MVRTALPRALFQARKIILLGWKSSSSPTVASWTTHMGNTLNMACYIYQNRGSPGKFEKLLAPCVRYILTETEMVRAAHLCDLEHSAPWS